MAKTDLEQLVVQLSADVKQYENALAKAQQTTVKSLRAMESSFNTSFESIDRRMEQFGLGLKAGIAAVAVAVVDSIKDMAKDAIKSAADIGKLSDKIGESTDDIQALAYGAAAADVSFDDLSGGLLKFSKNLGEAANHSGDLYKLLKANNVSLTDADGKQKSFNEKLAIFADLVKNAKNEQEALAIVTIGFGKGSDGWLNIFKNGAQGLDDFSKQARGAGAVIDESLIKKAQELDDRWALLMRSLKSQTESAVLSIIDSFQKITTPAAPATGQFIGHRFGSTPNPNYVAPIGTAGAQVRVARSQQDEFGYNQPPSKPTVLDDPEADAAAKRALDLYTQQQKAIKAVIDALSLEYDNLKRSKEQQAEYNEIKKAGSTVDEKQKATIIAKVQAIALEQQATETAAYAAEQLREKQQAFYEGLSYLAETGVEDFSDLVTGAKSLNDVLDDTLSSLVKLTLQAALLGEGPLAGLFGTQSSNGLGGLFGALLKSFNPATPANVQHTGGIIGMGGLVRNVSPGVFAGAPRYHSGGIAGLLPGEVPAILQRGEIVIPKNAARGGGGPNIQIIDQRTNAPAVEKQQDGNGNIRFLIRDALSRSVSNGEQDRSLGGRFGARPIRTRRG